MGKEVVTQTCQELISTVLEMHRTLPKEILIIEESRLINQGVKRLEKMSSMTFYSWAFVYYFPFLLIELTT